MKKFSKLLLLLPLSWLYASIVSLLRRMKSPKSCKKQEGKLYILCVGNLSVGGTGKTPHTIYLAKHLGKEFSLAILSRGYGRKSGAVLEVQLGGSAQSFGDEPLEIKRQLGAQCPVFVANKRIEGVEAIRKNYPKTKLIILDDGMQHWALARNYDILLTGFHKPYHLDYPLPLGRLREWRSGAQRAAAVVLSKCPSLQAIDLAEWREKLKLTKEQRLLASSFRYALRSWQGQACDINILRQKNLHLLCALAQPQNLVERLKQDAKQLKAICLRDHQLFSSKDIENWLDADEQTLFLSTEKDFSRLELHEEALQKVLNRIFIVTVELDWLGDIEAWLSELSHSVRQYIQQ